MGGARFISKEFRDTAYRARRRSGAYTNKPTPDAIYRALLSDGTEFVAGQELLRKAFGVDFHTLRVEIVAKDDAFCDKLEGLHYIAMAVAELAGVALAAAKDAAELNGGETEDEADATETPKPAKRSRRKERRGAKTAKLNGASAHA